MNQKTLPRIRQCCNFPFFQHRFKTKTTSSLEKIEIEKFQEKKTENCCAINFNSRRAIVWRRASPFIAGQIIVGPLVDPNIIDGVCSGAEITFCLGVLRGTDWQFKGEHFRGGILQSAIVADYNEIVVHPKRKLVPK